MAAITPVKWTRDLVNTFWDGFAQTRLTQLSFSELAGHECLYVFSSFLDKSVAYLDFGSGDGALADLLCQAGYSVAVYDPSGDRTRLAVDRLSKHKTFLGVVDRDTKTRFGGIFLVEVAEHVLDEDLAETYSTISKLLSDGGLLFLTTPNREDLDLGACYEPTNGVLFHRWQHVRSFDRSSLATMLRDYDLNEVVIHEIDFRPEFIKAVKDMIAGDPGADPFASRRPVYMSGGPNLVGVFSKGRSDIRTSAEPYVINMKIVAESPLEVYDSGLSVSRLELSPESMTPDSGFSYCYQLPQTCETDKADGSLKSRLRVYENDVRLGSAHAMHDAVRTDGHGRFSHWEGGVLYFSSSDNSDPRSNGKTYSVTFPLTETAP